MAMDEATFLGMLVIGLATLTGLYALITRPMLKLGNQMTEFNINIKTLFKKQDEQEISIGKNAMKNTKDHAYLHEKVDYNSDRIATVEGKLEITPPPRPKRNYD